MGPVEQGLLDEDGRSGDSEGGLGRVVCRTGPGPSVHRPRVKSMGGSCRELHDAAVGVVPDAARNQNQQ